MFCKKCGTELQEGQAICTKCGFAVGTGEGFCPNCGQPCEPGQAMCTGCGYSLGEAPAVEEEVGGKSKMVAGLLGIFLGSLGIHNFYLGYTGRGLTQLLVSVLSLGILSFAMGIWALIEGIFYLTGHQGYTTDAKGRRLAS